jgi:hypothetical protein
VIFVSRERYAEPRAVIEEKVLKWSGMELAASLAPAKATADTAANSGDGTSNQVVAEEDVPTGPVRYPKILTEEEREAESQAKKQGDELSLESDVAPPPQDYLVIRPERMAAITAAVAKSTGRQPKKEKPKFSHTCSRCSKKWDLPIQLDPSRPMYCPDCMPIVREERKHSSGEVRKVMRTAPTPEREEGSIGTPGRPRVSVAAPEERGTVKVVQRTEESLSSDSDDVSLAALLRPARSAASPSSSGSAVVRTPGSSEAGQGDAEKKRRRRKRGGRKIREAEAARAQAATQSSSTPVPSRPHVPPPPVRPLREPEIVALPDLSLDRPVSSSTPNNPPPPPVQAVPPGQRVRFD